MPSNRSNVRIKFLPPNQEKPVQKDLTFVDTGVWYYFNSQHLLYQLGKDARAFYDFLCEKMNNGNLITIDAALKLSFVHYFSSIHKPSPPSVNSLSTYVSNMKNLGLLIEMGNLRSGFYCINPKYAFKGSKEKRIKLLQTLIKSRGELGLSLKGLINTPEDEFLIA